MTGRGANETIEIERKYEVAASAQLPTADAFAAIGLHAQQLETRNLKATYFDTATRQLAALGIAARHRTGGPDAGWHLKQRGRAGVRELQWPDAPGGRDDLIAELTKLVPDAFAGALSPADPLIEIATLETTREVVMLSDNNGTHLVELVDDSVFATQHQLKPGPAGREGAASPAGGSGEVPTAPQPIERAWREWEAELVSGAPEGTLDAVEPLLAAAGAIPSLSSAKIARASGLLIEAALAREVSADQLAALAVMELADRLAARNDYRRSQPSNPSPGTAHDGPQQAREPVIAELRELVERLSPHPSPAQ